MNYRPRIGAFATITAALALPWVLPTATMAQDGPGTSRPAGGTATLTNAGARNQSGGVDLVGRVTGNSANHAATSNTRLLVPPVHNYDGVLKLQGIKEVANRQAMNAYLQHLDTARHATQQAHLEMILTQDEAGHSAQRERDAAQKYAQSLRDYETMRRNGAVQLQRQLGAAWTPGIQQLVAGREIHESLPLTPHWQAPPLVPATAKERAIAAKSKVAPLSPEARDRAARENMAACCGK